MPPRNLSCMTSSAIEALLEESRRFPPSADFAAQANATAEIYAEAERDYAAFWASWARKLEWIKPFTVTLEWNEPFARWFGDGQLNVSVNCLDRHVRAGRGEKIAYLLRRRARRPPNDHVPRAARRRQPIRQRLAQARNSSRRSRRDLYADDPRTSRRDAGLRSNRRRSLR